MIEPIVRLDEWQTNDHSRKFSSVTLHLAHFIRENAKVFAEYTSKLSRPLHTDPKEHRDNRAILQVEVGF